MILLNRTKNCNPKNASSLSEKKSKEVAKKIDKINYLIIIKNRQAIRINEIENLDVILS